MTEATNSATAAPEMLSRRRQSSGVPPIMLNRSRIG